MSELLSLLCSAVEKGSDDDTVALLLSGGIDSTSVGIALQKSGKAIRAYTYRLQDYKSRDLDKAVAIARHFGWPLSIIEVPTADLARDFMRLAVEHRCRKKTQFENTFPMLYVLPRIAEAEVWTGYNADDHYGNTKNCILDQKRMAREGASAAERKEAFDAERRGRFERKLTDPESGTWCYAHRFAAQCGKRLLDPYLDDALREFFLRFDHETLSPLKKPFVRQALGDELRDLPEGSLTVGVRLQTGGSVDTLFETLLRNPAINRFEKNYEDVQSLCERWGREVAENPEPFLAKLRALPSRSAPIVTTTSSDTTRYRPYVMDDVRLLRRAQVHRRVDVRGRRRLLHRLPPGRRARGARERVRAGGGAHLRGQLPGHADRYPRHPRGHGRPRRDRRLPGGGGPAAGRARRAERFASMLRIQHRGARTGRSE
jgi:Asparagine synthase